MVRTTIGMGIVTAIILLMICSCGPVDPKVSNKPGGVCENADHIYEGPNGLTCYWCCAETSHPQSPGQLWYFYDWDIYEFSPGCE